MVPPAPLSEAPLNQCRDALMINNPDILKHHENIRELPSMERSGDHLEEVTTTCKIPVNAFVDNHHACNRDESSCTHVPVSCLPLERDENIPECSVTRDGYAASPRSLRQLIGYSQSITTSVSGEECDTAVPEGTYVQQMSHHIVENASHTREKCPHLSVEPSSTSVNHNSNLPEIGKADHDHTSRQCSTPSHPACDEIEKFQAHSLSGEDDAQACITSEVVLDRCLRQSESDVTPKTEGVYHSSLVYEARFEASVLENKRAQEMAERIVERGPRSQCEECDDASLESPSSFMMQDTDVSEAVKSEYETLPNENSMPSPSACDESESMDSLPLSHAESEQARLRSGSQSDVTRNTQSRSPDECPGRSESEVGSPKMEVVHHSLIVHGEQCHTDIPGNQRTEQVPEDIVEKEPDTHHVGNDNNSLEAPSLSTMRESNVSEIVKSDFEAPPKEDSMPVPSPGDEIEIAVSQLHSHADGVQTCPRSGSQADENLNLCSRSPDECLEQSECEEGPSKTGAVYHASSQGDDVVGAGESRTSTSSEDATRDRDTSVIAMFHPDIVKTRCAHSLSTPSLKSSDLTAASSYFRKIGGLVRTNSDFARLESDSGRSKVTVPKQNGCEDIVQGTDPCSREQGSKDSLSKSQAGIDIPESRGTVPSGCNVQCGSGKELNKTNISAMIHDDFVADMRSDHREASMDSSSTSLRQLDPPKPGLAHSTPALGSADSVCSSSDLDRVENGESIKASPHDIRRTYSSSVDTLVEEDIETLTTTSIQHTIISTSNSNASHRTNSSLLIGSNESAVHQRQFVETLSDQFDIERDPLSASSLDAEGAWREDHNFPRPHSRVKRMYSSSDSSPDSVPDHEECIEISDSVTEALANNQWHAYVSECRRCSSTIEGRELERLSKSGRLPHTGFTSSESVGSLSPHNAETAPLLRRNPSLPVHQKDRSQGRTRQGMKSALAKKAARLLNFVLRKKNRSGNDNPESQAKVKKRSLSSLLFGRSS